MTDADETPAVRLGPAAADRCRRRIHLDHDPDADRSARRAPGAGPVQRNQDLAVHRESVRRRLSAGMTLSSAPAATDACWQVPLASGTRYATPDVLLPSPAGGYLPVLVRGHRTRDPGGGARQTALHDITSYDSPLLLRPAASRTTKMRPHHEDALALAHVYRLLEELGMASSEPRGGIIGRGGPAADPGWDDGAVIVWHDLTGILGEYDARVADRLAVARAAAARAPALAQPSRIAECRRCPWWTVCGPELRAAHDVSLLAAGSDVGGLRAAGARTYDDVAAMDMTTIAALPLTSIPTAEARTRARALVSGVPLVRRSEAVDPVCADVELDVDMEAYSDDGAYLWGTYLTGPGVAELAGRADGFRTGYAPFVTWEPLDTAAAGANFVDFWRYLTALRDTCAAAGVSFTAYCYSHAAEERWLYGTPARFPDVPGMPTRREVREFCASPQWVDLYLEVKRCFVVPGSMRLKEVATVAGFAWRDAEPGGENSMAWYRRATGGGRGENGVIPTEAVAANRQRILDYNEDDVRATWALRQWMSQEAGRMPTVADLDAAW